MMVQLLIDSIVRQITVLIAQLAPSGGVRAPLAHVANQVFVELAQELEAQGISRKVSADMFGMALRAYIRKVRRLSEGKTDQGRTLWRAVLDFVRDQPMVSRVRVLERFRGDGEIEVSAILHDLLESGLLFASGSGPHTVFRAVSEQEISQVSRLYSGDGLDELVWVTVFRAGPGQPSELFAQSTQPTSALSDSLDRLVQLGRVTRHADGQVSALEFVVPLGASSGWEAAVFDHLQAVVQTICQRLSGDASERELIGGSTYTFDVWPGHPLSQAVKQQLQTIRESCGKLREQVSSYNAEHGLPQQYEQITTYVGQNILGRHLTRTDIL